jgi:microcystin degradation protein MlrC
MFETGARAARVLLRILHGAKPVTARVKIPALVRGDELKTDTGLLGRFIRKAQAIEASSGGLSAAMMIGNPFTDVPDLRSNSLVVIDGDAERAEREALALAEGFWEVRDKLQAPLTSIAQAIEFARGAEGTVIFTDAADATSSGAPGDSNAILRGLLEAEYEGTALMPIVDRAAAEAAFAAGVGQVITVAVGGSLDRGRHQPVTLQARVRMLSDGHYASEYSGSVTDAGLTAVLESKGFTLVVTSRSVSLTDRSLFLSHGQDPRKFDIVVVKSPHCRFEFYEAWAERVINVDAPGSTSANLHSLGHTRCPRPIFPLEPETPFVPEVQIFRRS